MILLTIKHTKKKHKKKSTSQSIVCVSFLVFSILDLPAFAFVRGYNAKPAVTTETVLSARWKKAPRRTRKHAGGIKE